MIDTSTLMTGGGLMAAGAALGVFWSHIKSTFSYLSSFIFVEALVTELNVMPVRMYLKSEWKLMPAGKYLYMSRLFAIRNGSNSSVVPFRLPMFFAFRKGWRFIFVRGHNEIYITSIRGMIDFDSLVDEALDFYEDWSRSNPDKSSRYYVNKVYGEEKFLSGADMMRVRSDNTGTSEQVHTSGGMFDVDVGIDISFRYTLDEYLSNSREDPFESLYYSPSVMAYVKQARQWMEMREWYSERDIPWRRGWLLHGLPGSGKSSLSKAVAQMLGIPIYQYYLSTLTDNEFMREWDAMSIPCMALLEDIDTVFHGRESQTEHKSLSFDTVLNAISGVSSNNGVFLVVTTNNLDKIDPALGVSWSTNGISTRPGRIDSVIALDYMDETSRYKMANRILRDWPEEVPMLIQQSQQVTSVQFQEMCIQRAFELVGNRFDRMLPTDA